MTGEEYFSAPGVSNTMLGYLEQSPAHHGMSESIFYKKWKAMKHRCGPTWKKRKDYFDRGIKVCERWQLFENFLADMGPTYAEGLEIDRKNNDGDYEPGNCRWATKIEQMNNRRTNHFVEWNGERRTIAEWSRAVGMPFGRISTRLKRGWSIERTLSTPAQ